MADAGKSSQKRHRGRIETLPSGARRIVVYAGEDPLTGRRHYVRETVPAGPNVEKEAEKVRVRILNEINEQRNARTNATVNQLMDRYLELVDVDASTRQRYESVIRTHIRPLIGRVTLARLDAETFDSFYRTLRACRDHCGGRKFVIHRTRGEHACDDKCRAHECRPLSNGTIRKVHWCLSGAFKDAIRWKWITINPLDQAEASKGPTSNPQPPTPDEAAAIVNEAFKDLRWGMFVWLAMTTGARRGELCALRWDRLDLDNAALWIRTSIAQNGQQTREKDTKTHQQRRIALDAETGAGHVLLACPCPSARVPARQVRHRNPHCRLRIRTWQVTLSVAHVRSRRPRRVGSRPQPVSLPVFAVHPRRLRHRPRQRCRKLGSALRQPAPK
ncbi:integrase [Saccharomonospora amisosensis]|uniref:Integrase n=1 Tax=Saccharomonospora amisosensis TaxID=1128677 RepID=A0A7X5ZP52_9PSEU|nr:tyrosine-type recombinase/integrase [Saccharomonospora amisosensis]NIJ10448.1 integrase [Saccharomonospora amisosensis]